jgi:heavy metal sensor kinase
MKYLRERIWSPGIRVQLTLWYIAVFAILLLCSDVLLYTNLKTALTSNLDHTLQLQAQQIASDISYEKGTIVVDNETPGLDTDGPDQQGQQKSSEDVNFSTIVGLLNARGQVVRRSLGFHSLIVPALSVSQPFHGTPWLGTVATSNGQAVRLYSMALIKNGVAFGVVQVGESLTQFQMTLRSLVVELLVLAPLVLILGALGSYWLAARAFIPIDSLTRTARSIEAGDLHQRVPIPQAQDEVQHLALTLNEMIARLESAFARQRRFVADASHELRTPVAVICNMAEMALLNALTTEEYVSALSAISAEAERLGYLISDLLALARIDEGQTRLEREPVRLDRLVYAVVAQAKSMANERAITLEVQAPEPIVIFGDETRLIQMVMNLLDNALLYTNPGGEVTLTTTVKQRQAILSIRDTGIGIAPEHLPHIFERFYRADPARVRTEGNNSGLGLAIVDWVVRAHGGVITVESQVGQGSTFVITLPVLAEEASGDTFLS